MVQIQLLPVSLLLQITRRQFRRLQMFLSMTPNESLSLNTFSSTLFECVFSDSEDVELVCAPSFALASRVAYSHFPDRKLVCIRIVNSVICAEYSFD